MSSDTVQFPTIMYDGVTYPFPWPLEPAERAPVAEWSGGLRGARLLEALVDADPLAFACFAIIALKRSGVEVDPYKILNDREFDSKFSIVDGDDASPPDEAADDAASSDSDMTTTP